MWPYSAATSWPSEVMLRGGSSGTVAPWGLPGLALAALTAAVAARALLQRAGHRLAAALALAVTVSIVSLYMLNLPIAPPVP